jgi:NADH:ubiquinone oxidoreductase subunit 3 (subunit A)
MILEVILGGLLAVVLLGVAAYFIRQQKKTLDSLRNGEPPAREDRLYLRKQVNRRLMCSFLMVVIAGMLAGSLFLDDWLRGPLRDQEQLDQLEIGQLDLDKEKRELASAKVIYWVAVLFVLFVMLFLAILDLMATARFGLRQHRQLESERKAMLQEQVARWRRK